MAKSTRFVLPDEIMNKNPQAIYKMENDVVRGFKIAAKSNQSRLALEYLTHVVDVLVATVDELSAEIASLKAEKAPAKKAAAKSATAEDEVSAE